MSFGVGIGDITLVAQFAWQTYSAIKNAPSEFRSLEAEVQSLSISLKSFDDDDTRHAILKYTVGSVQREENFSVLLKNSQAALKPLNDLVKNYDAKSHEEKKVVRDWLNGVRFARKNLSVQDFRNKLAMHTASLNIFLTSLTNFSIGRLEKLLFAGTASGAGIGGMSGLGGSKGPPVSEDGLDGTWSSIGPLLVRGSMTQKEVASKVTRFRVDILNYLDFLMDGGKPYSRKELNKRRDETKTVTFSLPIGYDGVQMRVGGSRTSERQNVDLMTLVNQMVVFDEGTSEEDDQEMNRAPSVGNVPSPGMKSPRSSFSAAPPTSPPSAYPNIITVEPRGSPKSPKSTIYTYPVERTPSGNSITRTPSGGPGQPKSPKSPPALAKSPSANSTYGRPPSINSVMFSRTPSVGGAQPRSLSWQKGILSMPPELYCDVSSCRRQVPTGGRYFHCGQCAEAGYDVCMPCYEQVRRCPGRSRGLHGPMEERIVGMLYSR